MGGRASAETYAVPLIRPGLEGEALAIGLRYDDKSICLDGDWRIYSRFMACSWRRGSGLRDPTATGLSQGLATKTQSGIL